MRKYLFLAVLLALTLALAACATGTPVEPVPTAVPAAPTEEAVAPAAAPEYAGTYTAALPAADTPGRTVTAVLAEDGAIEVTSDYQNGQSPVVERGSWQPNADGGVTVTLTEQDGQDYFEPRTFLVTREADTGELVVTGADGAEVRMRPGTAEPAAPAETPAEAVAPDTSQYLGTYMLSAPDGGVLAFMLSEDGVVKASISYPDGTQSTVISGTWEPNADGGLTAIFDAEDGQPIPPQTLMVMLDAASGELALISSNGEELRLTRATDEQTAALDKVAVMTPTVEMTSTEVVTITIPVTGSNAMTLTLPVTATEMIGGATPVTATESISATGTVSSTDALVAETLQNTYIASLPAASGGGTRLIALHLHDNGTVRMATDYQTDQPNIVVFGAWQDNGDGTLTVTLTGREDQVFDQPEVITFTQDGDLLVATAYDEAVWGSEGLTLERASDVAEALNTALIHINLQAGFPLDPTFVSVNAGGEVDASLLIDECEGFINTQPVVTVEWTGEAPFIKAFFVSDDDPTMVVGTPDGKVLCNDDANDQLLDPRIRIDDPITGTYKIWLGSYSRGQLIPGVLVLTTSEDVTLSTFDLGSFIQRPALPEAPSKPTPIASPTVTGTATLKVALPELTAETPITRTLVVSGAVPVFQLGVEDPTCSGLVTIAPDLVFGWTGETEQIRVFFEGDGDATLMVMHGTERTLACADETDAGNRNPLVAFDNPDAGLYGVWVGRLDPSKPITGVLTITTDPEATPVILEPVPQPAGGAGLPNPASAFCVNQGGTVDIRATADGSQSGFCVFPDGSECDEWAYYRGECKPGQTQ